MTTLYLRYAALAALVSAPFHSGDALREFPEKLAPYFHPPKALANDFAKYRSPLQFDDGTLVKSPADWPRRRQEILKTWHGLMGEWPPLIEKPKIEYLEKERRGNITQWRVRIEIAP